MSESLEVWEMRVADYLNLLCDKRPSPLDPYVVEANERLASQADREIVARTFTSSISNPSSSRVWR
jgi:hypothetical protein